MKESRNEVWAEQSIRGVVNSFVLASRYEIPLTYVFISMLENIFVNNIPRKVLFCAFLFLRLLIEVNIGPNRKHGFIFPVSYIPHSNNLI